MREADLPEALNGAIERGLATGKDAFAAAWEAYTTVGAAPIDDLGDPHAMDFHLIEGGLHSDPEVDPRVIYLLSFRRIMVDHEREIESWIHLSLPADAAVAAFGENLELPMIDDASGGPDVEPLADVLVRFMYDWASSDTARALAAAAHRVEDIEVGWDGFRIGRGTLRPRGFPGP